MFQEVLFSKKSFFPFFSRRKKARAAAIIRGDEIFFLNHNQKTFRISVGKKIGERAGESVAIIPEEKVFYKILSVPDGTEVSSAIQESLVILPFHKDEAVWEYAEIQPLAAEPGHKDFAFWAAPRKYLEDYNKLMQSSGIRIVDFLPEATGIAKAVIPSLETSDAILIVAITEKGSTLAIFAGRAIHFSAVLSLGGKELESGRIELEDQFLSEILQATFWYKNRALHEHGASHSINRIVFLGKVPESVISRVALNIQLRVETPDVLQGASAEFVPLIGALKR